MPRPGPTDTVPAMLTPGEAVLNKEAAALVGRENIKEANQKGLQMRKQVQGYEDGGLVGNSLAGLPGTTESRNRMANVAFTQGDVAQTELARNQSADQFATQTGYKPGTATFANDTVNPISETGAVATSPTALQAPSVGTSIPGVQRIGNSFSKAGVLPKIADTTGVQSAIGAVTQPVTTGIMRGFSGSKVPGVQRVGNNYSKSAFQGYADGTEEVPSTKKIIETTTGVDKGLVRPSVPLPAEQAAAQVAANAPQGPVQPFESMPQTNSGIYKRKPSSMKQLVPVGEGSTPTVKEPVSVKEGFFTEPKAAQPNFTAQPNYEGTIPPNRQVSVVPKAAAQVAANPWGDSITVKDALKGAKGILGKTAGTVLSGLGAAQSAYAAAQTAVEPSQRDEYLKAKAARGDTKAAEVLASGGSNPIMESMKTPVRNRLDVVGDTVGNAVGSLGDRLVNSVTPTTTKAANTESVAPETVAPSRPKGAAETPPAASTPEPITEFAGNGVNLAQGSGKQDKRGIFGANTKEKSEALQRTIDYNAKPETQAMFAREAQIVADRKAKSDAWDVANRPQQAQQPTFVQGDEVNPNDEYRAQLENIILNRGPSSRMSVGEFAAAKHKRAAALGILSGLDARENAQRQASNESKRRAIEAQNASQQFGLEQQKLVLGQKNVEATNAATSAQQAYNRQHQEATEAEAKRANDIREQAETNKPHKASYLGEEVLGTPQEIEAQKSVIDKNNFITSRAKKYSDELFTGKQGGQERAEQDWKKVEATQEAVKRALADPETAKNKDAILAAYKKETGLDFRN